MPRTLRTVLTDDLLAAIHDRAAGHDRDNSFPHDDLAGLRAVGYLTAFVPRELGGAGLTLEEVAREQARLAAAAPATALSVNMHLVVTGMAALLHARGDDSMAFVLTEAVAGEVFAFGSSEAGNDLVMFGSRTRAERQPDGGYRYYGTKIFTSLAPVWTRLATFGLDEQHPDGPRLVHGVVTREGVTTTDDWDTLGMRATQSGTTVLDGAYAPPDRIVRTLPPGPSPDPFIVALFEVFEILLAAVYTGIGRRALALGAEATGRRTSMKYDGRSYSQDPDIRWKVADAALTQDGAELQVFALARGIDEGDDYGPRLFAQLVGLKVRATESARVVVDLALRVAGGAGYYTGQELSRLYRDVLAGIYHPSDDESAHATVAQSMLGPLDS
jgi:alkylation response protein AidB-like acyl-CoA dehydrogenase